MVLATSLGARRRHATVLVVATLMSVVPLVRTTPAGAQTDPRPNVLLILTDDQRPWGTLRTQDAVRDRIRDRGVRFSRAFTTTPLCCPSRASLLTGLYSHNHGIVDNNRPFEALAQVDAMTFVHSLHDAGYTTGMFGKYLNGWPNEVSPSGFDRFAVTPRVTYGPEMWNIDGAVREVRAYSTTFIRRQTLTFLDWAAESGSPWFAYVTPKAPHMPATPDPRYADLRVGRLRVNPAMTEADRSDKPPYVREIDPRRPEYWAAVRAAQLRSLASVDDLVDAVLDRLHALGELKRTLVIYASDNGYTWGEHGLKVGGKSTPYLPSVRVPMFVRWTGHLEPGAVDGRVVALLDLAPTILAATGTPPPYEMDGLDLFSGAQRSRLLLEYTSPSGFVVPSWTGIVSSTIEYVEYVDAEGAVAFREYYDLTADRHQLVNLLGDPDPDNDPETASLSADLEAMRGCAGADCVGS